LVLRVTARDQRAGAVLGGEVGETLGDDPDKVGEQRDQRARQHPVEAARGHRPAQRFQDGV